MKKKHDALVLQKEDKLKIIQNCYVKYKFVKV